jgi:hypothetical protein
LDVNNAGSTVRNNVFKGNGGTAVKLRIYDGQASPAPTVRGNVIENNNVGVSVSGSLSSDLGTPSERGRNIIRNNTEFGVKNTTSDSVQAVGNYWSVTSASAIDDRIYDDEENSGSGPVIFDPFLNAPPEDGNTPPIASPDSFSVSSDSTLLVEAPGLLENDSDPDGDSLSASLVSGVSDGSLSLDADGFFEYVPTDGFGGTDSFTYEAIDDSSAADTASVAIAVESSSPTPPPSLVATASSGSIELDWEAAVADDVATYRIYRDTVPVDSTAGPSPALLHDSTQAGATTFSDSTVAPDTTYHYRVTAVDSASKESAYSPEATTALDPTEIALASGGPNGLSYEPPAPEPGTENNPVGRFRFSAEQPGAALDAVAIENAGSPPTGVAATELWHSSDASYDPETATHLATDTTSVQVQFEDLGLSLPTDSTYLFLVVDLEAGAGGDYRPTIPGDEDLSLTGGKLAMVNGASDGTFSNAYLSSSSTALPVELTTFEALLSGESATIRWTTASETKNAGFAVQHRADSTETWQKMGFVASNAEGGTTTDAQTYRYQTETLEVGTHQFRLRQVDMDGTAHLSEPIETEVTMDEAYRLTSYPNPVARQATVKVVVREEQKVQLLLYDTLGRRVAILHNGALPAQETKKMTLRVNRRGLSSGVYFLRLDGEKASGTRRLTIVR